VIIVITIRTNFRIEISEVTWIIYIGQKKKEKEVSEGIRDIETIRKENTMTNKGMMTGINTMDSREVGRETTGRIMIREIRYLLAILTFKQMRKTLYSFLRRRILFLKG